MTCYHPVRCWYSVDGGPLSFREPAPGDASWCRGTKDCMKCRGCLRKYAGEWSVRCVHEAKMHKRNCFVTLTYDHANLPLGGSLRKRDFIDFIKRLRDANRDLRIKFFGCGEYGPTYGRPHYHICLFGVDFDDAVLSAKSKSGESMFTSKALDAIWSNGIATVQPLTEATAAYTAGYVLKKLQGVSVDPSKEREFIHMSRRPGIAEAWFDLYHRDVIKRDAATKELSASVVLLNETGARVVPAPNYYLRLLRKWSEDDYAEIKDLRMLESEKSLADRTRQRLLVREAVDAANGARQTRDSF